MWVFVLQWMCVRNVAYSVVWLSVCAVNAPVSATFWAARVCVRVYVCIFRVFVHGCVRRCVNLVT